MMNQNFAEEQLLELLLQLKKATSTAARKILNDQPQIAYALISLMVSMGAVDVDVIQRTLAEYGGGGAGGSAAVSGGAGTSTPQPSINAAAIATPSLPMPMQYLNTPPAMMLGGTPQSSFTPPPLGPGPSSSLLPPPTVPNSSYGYPSHQQQQQQQYGGGGGGGGVPPFPPHHQQQQHYHQQQQQQQPNASGSASTLPSGSGSGSGISLEVLAGIPDDQKALIVQVISMTPEQVNALGPQERATFMQLRATLGVPT